MDIAPFCVAHYTKGSRKGASFPGEKRLSYDEIMEAMKTTLQLAVERKYSVNHDT